MSIFNSLKSMLFGSSDKSKLDSDTEDVVKPTVGKHVSFDNSYNTDSVTGDSVNTVVLNNDDNFKTYFEIYAKSLPFTKKNRMKVSVLNKVDSDKKQIRHQVVFILDATGSMSAFIEGTKKEINKLIDTLKAKASDDFNKTYAENINDFEFVFEVAVIAYRDFTDKSHFDTCDFTTDIDSVRNFLGTVSATGGDDCAEDVKGAFIHALFGIDNKSTSLSWDHGDVASRSVLWLADALPHGKLFNTSNYSDNYLYDSEQEWNVLFDKMAKQNISYYVVKLNNATDKANTEFAKLANTYNVPFELIDVSQSVYVDSYGSTAFRSEVGYSDMSEVLSKGVNKSTRLYVSDSISSGWGSKAKTKAPVVTKSPASMAVPPTSIHI